MLLFHEYYLSSTSFICYCFYPQRTLSAIDRSKNFEGKYLSKVSLRDNESFIVVIWMKTIEVLQLFGAFDVTDALNTHQTIDVRPQDVCQTMFREDKTASFLEHGYLLNETCDEVLNK